MEPTRTSAPKYRSSAYFPSLEIQGINNYNKTQAKQRASVQWLLSKAYSHQVPEELKEAFYRDVEDQEYLKPTVMHALANAELYCLALAHIYSDPNYSQLNHWGVLQALARKGVDVREPSDVALTETTLIHTSPLRMSAHMAVMEGVMSLFVKEVVSAEKVVTAIRRFTELDPTQTPPKEPEEALLLWIAKACQALKKRIASENNETGPNFPELRELADLSDGVNLFGLLAFYCPDVVDWTQIASNEPFSTADCLYNLEMVQNFCAESLPHNIFHLGLEDIVYMHNSVRLNVLTLLADLFFILEIRPAKCVRPPGLRDRFPVVTDGGSKGSQLIRRQGSLQERDRTKRQTVHEVAAGTPSNPAVRKQADEENSSFVVHRGKTVPTLYNVAGGEGTTPRPGGSRVAAIKERFNMDTKAEERGEDPRSSSVSGGSFSNSSTSSEPAGVPSNREERKIHSSGGMNVGGRRSRRNSITSDDCHLTIENFGGSQDNLSMFGRNPDKEPVTLQQSGMLRRPSTDMPAGTPSTPAGMNNWRRNNDNSQENLSDYLMDNRDVEEQLDRRSRASSPSYSSISSTAKSNNGHHNRQQFVIIASSPNSDPVELIQEAVMESRSKATNFAELSKLRDSLSGSNSAINIVYMQQQDKDTTPGKSGGFGGSSTSSPMTQHRRTSERKGNERMTIAEATSWDPQTPASSTTGALDALTADDMSSAADLYGIRLKMEEKRKRIEAEKRQMELVASQQRAKVGKAAFLQAVSKGKGDVASSPVLDYSPTMEARTMNPRPSQLQMSLAPEQPDYEFQPQQPHFQHQQHHNLVTPPGMHGMPYDPYSNGGGHQLPQQLDHQFYLHDQSPSPRRTWGQPQPMSPQAPPMGYQLPDGYGMPPQQPRRAQWGTPQPVRGMMNHHGYMMSPNPASYIDPATGYMMGPPRHPENPYDPPYYPNGAPQQYQQHPEMQQQEPYYYSPQGRPPYQYSQGYPGQAPPAGLPAQQPNFNMMPQQPSQQPPQQQQQQQQHSYPSAADQRPPFRLHSGDLPQQESVAGSPSSAQLPEPHRGSVDRRAPPTPSAETVTPSRPISVSRTTTPQRSSSNGSANSPVVTPGSVMHTAIPTPSIDDMEPQNVSFIETPGGVDEAELDRVLPRRLRNLNITSGNRTYRIPHEGSQSSPPRPALTKTFRADGSSPDLSSPSPMHHGRMGGPATSSSDEGAVDEGVKTAKLKENVEADRGFIITFDDDATGPKRPKPQLGAKRGQSPTKKISAHTGPSESASYSPASSSNNHRSNKTESRETSPRRSLSSLARDYRDDFMPIDSGFGGGHRDDLFAMATAMPGSLASPLGMDRNSRMEAAYDDSEDEDELGGPSTTGLVIGDELVNPDPETLDEMERKKEKILLQSMRRKQQQEEIRQKKELEAQQRKEEERFKEEEKQRKKEEEKARRAIIFEQYKIKKAMEEAEKEGRPYDMPDQGAGKSGPKMRARNNNNNSAAPSRPRPKTIHIETGTDYTGRPLMPSRGKRGSGTNLTDNKLETRGEGVRGSNPALNSRRGSNSSLHADTTATANRYRPMERGHSGRKDLSVPRYGHAGGSVRSSREDLYSSRNYRGSNTSLNDGDYDAYHTPLVHTGRKGSGFMTGGRQADATVVAATAAAAAASPSARPVARPASGHTALRRSGSLMDFNGESDSGAKTPTSSSSMRRMPSPAITPTSTPFRRLPSPTTGPGSLPPGLVSKRRGFDDGASDVSSNQDYIGPRLYKQPAARSNRSIILNAVEYCVFPGVVNREAKQRVLEEITRSESKNFLILFRDGGCQFRALYSFDPDREEIFKLYGNGPKMVNDSMFEKFFKYNSGGKCFSQVHTKHLTVTIDAFTIHAGLWQGKKTSLPNKKDMTLVI